MVAAVKDLDSPELTLAVWSHAQDFLTVIGRAAEIGNEWRSRIDELIFETPGISIYFHAAEMGSVMAPRHTMRPGTSSSLPEIHHIQAFFTFRDPAGILFCQIFCSRLRLRDKDPRRDGSWRSGLWYKVLEFSSYYRIVALQCQQCGDCIQEHLNYAGCTMRWCYKNCATDVRRISCRRHLRSGFRANVHLESGVSRHSGGRETRQVWPRSDSPRDWSLDARMPWPTALPTSTTSKPEA